MNAVTTGPSGKYLVLANIPGVGWKYVLIDVAERLAQPPPEAAQVMREVGRRNGGGNARAGKS
jgi:hypothetical protein